MYKKIISQLHKLKKINKNQMLVGVAVLAIMITGVLISSKSSSTNILSFLKFSPNLSAEAVAKKSIDYLNKSVLQQGQTATLVSFSKESGLVKIKLQIADKTYDSYATKDGKLLFPEAFIIDSTATTQTNQNTPPPPETPATVKPADIKKVAKTSLDAYIVSACPFGLQMQRAISEAIKTVPSLAQYVTVRYIGAVAGNTITAMHGDEEAQENLRQICIRDEQKSKYWAYASCYMKKSIGTAPGGMPYGDSSSCQAEAGIDAKKLKSCVSDPARGLTYAQVDFDLNTKYNIQGSPTLILNGEPISESDFGGRSPEAIRNIICSSSLTPGAFCSTQLNTTPATTSFSLTSAGTGSATASANTNCAPTIQ